ncbi:MAG: TetR/AcrR family transcriptional regulator [Atopobiaceae bacterium]|nr:TetR/AcrR family transcriptional regulator [Atopobiaceae bacterium]
MDDTGFLRGTKRRIVEAALDLFSQYGFEAVRVEQIATRVGIKAPSLYKHFKSKQEIFDTILQMMDEHHEAQVASLQMSLPNARDDASLIADLSEGDLVEKVLAMVRFVTHDEAYGKFRRMLEIERHRDAGLARLYEQRYQRLYVDYHTQLFTALMEGGALLQGDAEAMALQYFAPILLAIGIIDHQPEREGEMLSLIRRHVHQFMLAYKPARQTD